VVIDTHQMGFAFLGYFILSLFMTVGAMGTTKVLFATFCFVDLLLLGLFTSTWGMENSGIIWPPGRSWP
jgi:succinate-acetate transporter protein